MLAVNFTINVNGTFITIIRQKRDAQSKLGKREAYKL